VDYASLDDQVLMALIAHAQADALSALYDRYGRLVFSLALRIVGDHAAAEEITQDVFLRVWEKAGTYRSEQGSVSTWLTSIARHRAIDVLRRQRSRPERQEVDWALVSPEALPSINGPEVATEATFRRQQVQAALARLPDEQRQVLALAYFRGYTHRQIAEALDQPLGTVKTRIRLAMQKLRRMLQEE